MRMTPIAAIRSATALGAMALLLALDSSAQSAEPRYEFHVVRVEPAATVMLYRLDATTGEVCVFGFTQAPEPAQRGCIGAAESASPGRFALDAAQGARGTAQSSAYRLDRVTGAICRFRLPAGVGAVLERVSCTAGPAMPPLPPPQLR